MIDKINLNKLKEEIETQRKLKGVTSPHYNANETNPNIIPKNKFLTELKHSLDTGKESVSAKIIKDVNNAVLIKENKHKNNFNLPKSNNQTVTNASQQTSGYLDYESNERDNRLWEEFKRRNDEITSKFNTHQDPSIHLNNKSQINEHHQINESTLNSNIKGAIENYLVENFNGVIENAINSTILEIYTADKIKNEITKNKELIKSIVIETIREIQNKSNAKRQL